MSASQPNASSLCSSQGSIPPDDVTCGAGGQAFGMDPRHEGEDDDGAGCGRGASVIAGRAMSASQPNASSLCVSQGSMPPDDPTCGARGQAFGMDPRHKGEDDSILLERSHSPVCASRAALLWQGGNS